MTINRAVSSLKLRDFVFGFLVLATTWDILAMFIPMKIFSIFCIFYIIFYEHFRIRSSLVFFFVFMGIAFVDFLYGNKNSIYSLVFGKFIYVNIAILLMASVLCNNNRLDCWSKIAYWGGVVLAFSLSISVFIVFFMPGYSSVRSQFQLFGNSFVNQIQVSYGMAHALPCFLPVLLFWHKLSKNKDRFISLGLIVLILILLFKCVVTTSFLLSIITIIIFYIISIKNKPMRFGLIVFLVAFGVFVGISNVFVGTLNFFSELSDNEVFLDKMDDLSSFVTSGDTDHNQVSGRQELYNDSWQTFFNNSNGTWGTEELGGHSFLADHLAYYGIIPVLIYLLFYYFQFKLPINYLHPSVRSYYILSMFPCVGLMVFKGSGVVISTSMYIVVFILVPGLLLFLERKYKLS